MKVQINAGALVGACDRYIPKLEARIALLTPAPSWWDWIPLSPNFPLIAIKEKLERVQTFRAIAKHKNPNTILEITDSELDGVAPYLSEFSDPNGRIE